jgi:multiple sugar transport system permease protein
MRTTTPTLSDSSTVPLPAAHSRPRLSDDETFCGWLFITPALVGFTLFYLLPTICAFYIGLTNWNLLRAPKFLGLENYSRLLGDEKFWSSIWITVLYVVYNIPVQTVLGQLIAVLLKRLTGSVFVRSIVLAPFLISNVIAAMIWFWMLDPVLGFVNFILQAIGLGSHAFFSDEHLEKIDVLGKDIVNRY